MSRILLSAFTMTAVAVVLCPAPVPAQFYQTYEQLSGRRSYHLYPYTFSYGNRHDPYWSYNASYFPYHNQGDGSYYGLGYSGYGGRSGGQGNYWYW